ncbi:hypothetical protein RQP54_18015 [Curvibacter sp. APW13]|uniref:hypothetical protein n=1 Tax=Curvibacter sp. APW13 TaxID=3077236 RepID=UPI0028DF99EA|nr:hypothetical protein [Curvibacter sp. APW13]MDT8992774.1 hypothetical protein [Curvibacter sp. APW13]
MLTKEQAHAIAQQLKECPFCGLKPTPRIHGAGDKAVNPSARCVTPDCMGAKMPSINLDVPNDVHGWNTRTPPNGAGHRPESQ